MFLIKLSCEDASQCLRKKPSRPQDNSGLPHRHRKKKNSFKVTGRKAVSFSSGICQACRRFLFCNLLFSQGYFKEADCQNIPLTSPTYTEPSVSRLTQTRGLMGNSPEQDQTKYVPPTFTTQYSPSFITVTTHLRISKKLRKTNYMKDKVNMNEQNKSFHLSLGLREVVQKNFQPGKDLIFEFLDDYIHYNMEN